MESPPRTILKNGFLVLEWAVYTVVVVTVICMPAEVAVQVCGKSESNFVSCIEKFTRHTKFYSTIYKNPYMIANWKATRKWNNI